MVRKKVHGNGKEVHVCFYFFVVSRMTIASVNSIWTVSLAAEEFQKAHFEDQNSDVKEKETLGAARPDIDRSLVQLGDRVGIYDSTV